MQKSMVWVIDGMFEGWSCSLCGWRYSVPALLQDSDARAAYDRLATAKFKDHNCTAELVAPSVPPFEAALTKRLRALILSGLKPKDAVEIVLQ